MAKYNFSFTVLTGRDLDEGERWEMRNAAERALEMQFIGNREKRDLIERVESHDPYLV